MIDPNVAVAVATERDQLLRLNASLLGVLKEMTYYSQEADNVYWKHNGFGVGEWLFSLLKPLHVENR